MPWTIDQKPHLKADPPTKSDWFATLRSDDGTYVLLQIGYQADEARAKEITHNFRAAPKLLEAAKEAYRVLALRPPKSASEAKAMQALHLAIEDAEGR